MNDAPAILVLGPGGLAVARRIAEAVPEATIYGYRARLPDISNGFQSVAGEVQTLFRAGRPVIGICAAGILIRAVASLLTDKTEEPPVIAVAEDGSAVVPLLGGHQGGNDLAREIAAVLEIAPSITTAGDLRLGLALDDPPPGWAIADPARAKPVMAALLAGEPVGLAGDEELPDWLRGIPLERRTGLSPSLTLTTHAGEGNDGAVLVPKRLVLGIGAERFAETEALERLVEVVLAEAECRPEAVAAITTLDLKAAEPAIIEVASRLGVPVRLFDAVALEAETPRLATPSEVVFREVGCHGVAEASALAAVGPEGQLVVEKRIGNRVTCALASAPQPIDPATVGRPRGRLSVIGLGPGDPAFLAPAARDALLAAEAAVGYGLYLDLAGDLLSHAERHALPLGEETERARLALSLAAEGRNVVLVCSGDPGVYALATLAMECIETATDASWSRVDLAVLPGISAMQLAAARAGAPLGHDFCAISLSDLMTPWPVIENRLEAAAEGDFVIAFYNPVSRRREWQLGKAREILLNHRPATTPVIVARNLGRAGEQVRIVTLAELDADMVDMLTLVMVGNSQSRVIERPDGGKWVYTPRGYDVPARMKDRMA